MKVFSLESSGNNLGMANWKQIGQDIIGEASGDGFESSVSFSNDAETLAVGSPNDHGKNGDDGLQHPAMKYVGLGGGHVCD